MGIILLMRNYLVLQNLKDCNLPYYYNYNYNYYYEHLNKCGNVTTTITDTTTTTSATINIIITTTTSSTVTTTTSSTISPTVVSHLPRVGLELSRSNHSEEYRRRLLNQKKCSYRLCLSHYTPTPLKA